MLGIQVMDGKGAEDGDGHIHDILHGRSRHLDIDPLVQFGDQAITTTSASLSQNERTDLVFVDDHGDHEAGDGYFLAVKILDRFWDLG